MSTDEDLNLNPWERHLSPLLGDTSNAKNDADLNPQKGVGFNYGDTAVDPDRCYSWLRTERRSSKRYKSESESSDSSGGSVTSLPLPRAPDGGWGWFVVLGAFTVSFICDGLAFCFGVLYSELLNHFQESKSKTSLVGSIFFGVPMILGPLASSLSTRFGCRKVTMFGGVLSFFGFILSYFANSIEMLCFTFSVVVGAGFSCCYITSVVIVAFYFKKRRALATGLALCGTGVGTFSFAPLMDFLIQEYGLKGLFLIMAGISLNLVVCGMLFRPLAFTDCQRWRILLQEFNKIPYSRQDIEMARGVRVPCENQYYQDEIENFNEDSKALSVLSLPTFVRKSSIEPPSCVLIEALRNSRNPHHTLQRYMKNQMMRLESDEEGTSHGKTPLIESKAFVITPLSQHQTMDSEDTIDSLPSSILDEPVAACAAKLKESKNGTKTVVGKDDPISALLEPKELKPVLVKNNTSAVSSPLSSYSTWNTGKGKYNPALAKRLQEKEIKLLEKRLSGWHVGRYGVLGIHLPLYRTDIFYRRLNHQGGPMKQCMLGSSCPEFTDTTSVKSKRGYLCSVWLSFYNEMVEIIGNMVDVNLLRNPFFVIFSLSNFVYYFWSDVPYMFATDHAIHNGVEENKAAFILSIIGIFNTLGQVLFGYMGDLNINLLNVYAVVISFAGIAVSLVPLFPSYWTACAVYALFGFFVSANLPLTTVLLVKYVGVARLTSAYGLLMLIQGIGNLLGPPVGGWIADVVGTYNMAFYLAGIFHVVSGIVLFLVYIPAFKATPYVPDESDSAFALESSEGSDDSFEHARLGSKV